MVANGFRVGTRVWLLLLRVRRRRLRGARLLRRKARVRAFHRWVGGQVRIVRVVVRRLVYCLVGTRKLSMLQAWDVLGDA